MAHDNDVIDFGAPLPPDTADGKYWANILPVKAKSHTTKSGAEMAFLEFQIEEAITQTDECEASVGSKVSKIFMPKAPSRENLRGFKMFQKEVQNLCKLAKVSPPSIKQDEVGSLDAWRPFLDSLAGSRVQIEVKNAADKNGVDRCNVYLTTPRGLVSDDGE